MRGRTDEEVDELLKARAQEAKRLALARRESQRRKDATHTWNEAFDAISYIRARVPSVDALGNHKAFVATLSEQSKIARELLEQTLPPVRVPLRMDCGVPVDKEDGFQCLSLKEQKERKRIEALEAQLKERRAGFRASGKPITTTASSSLAVAATAASSAIPSLLPPLTSTSSPFSSSSSSTQQQHATELQLMQGLERLRSRLSALDLDPTSSSSSQLESPHGSLTARTAAAAAASSSSPSSPVRGGASGAVTDRPAFATRFKPIRYFSDAVDPSWATSITSGSMEEAEQQAEATRKAKEEWASKLIVDDPFFHVLRSSGTLAGAVPPGRYVDKAAVRDAINGKAGPEAAQTARLMGAGSLSFSSSLDKTTSILRDRPMKQGFKQLKRNKSGRSLSRSRSPQRGAAQQGSSNHHRHHVNEHGEEIDLDATLPSSSTVKHPTAFNSSTLLTSGQGLGVVYRPMRPQNL